MANEEHLKILKQGVEAWNKWREENPNVTADFSEAELGELNLSGANLHRARLYETSLYEVSLVEANLSDADLGRADLNAAKLIKANLSGANLGEANLNGADLDSADLHSANLRGADLGGADLHSAYLRGANLGDANLAGANLAGADLSRADLSRANLSSAYLGGTNFAEADLSRTVFADVALQKVQGLRMVTHSGPSTVGLDTLARSEGNLPEVFLRGCGLSDWEIEAAKIYRPDLTPEELTDITYKIHALRVDNPIQFFSCFISYSHADKPFARHLHDTLQDSGIRCWLDERQMLPGDDIYEQIERGIKLWDKVLLCCSEASLTSWWVDNEMDLAFEKERQLMRERSEQLHLLIPLNLDGYMFTDQWKSGKKRKVHSRIAADFTGWQDDEDKVKQNIELVIRALRADAGRREQPPPSRL